MKELIMLRCKSLVCLESWNYFLRTTRYAILIQKSYSGYKTRRKLKVFKKLPCDLWKIVLFYTRYQHNIQVKFRRSITDIYESRYKFLNNVINLSYNNLTIEKRRDTFYEYNTLKNSLKLLRNKKNNLKVLFNNYQNDERPCNFIIK